MGEQDQQREKMQRRRDQMRKRMSTTFDRAVNDPQFRQQLLDDPKLALSSSGDPKAPQIPLKAQEQRRQLLEQVIDRAQSDPQFREHLKQEPQKALWDAGFGPPIEQLRAELPQEEVRAYTASWWGGEWIWSGLVNPWGSGGWPSGTGGWG